jgi:preprotein translocase subunit YajC
MKKVWFVKSLFSICIVFLFTYVMLAQPQNHSQMKSQEVSEDDGLPVLLKHLPEWENVRNRAIYANEINDLRQELGERPVLNTIDFIPGTEAVTAPYEQGKLLIVEFATPQGSVDTDNRVNQLIAETGQNQPFVYRRIGNYNAFVFDAPDEAAANALLDQVKYEKMVQWLGTNPFILRRAERAFINDASDLFVSTVLMILSGIGLAIVAGLAVGVFFFYLREQKRSTMEAFSDAGGMIRLNLDGLTPKVSSDRLLK